MTSGCSATRSPRRGLRPASRSSKRPRCLRLAIEDLYPGRIALVSSFGADAAALLHMVSEIDAATPVIFVDTGQHFPETLAYREALCETLKLANVIVATPKADGKPRGAKVVFNVSFLTIIMAAESGKK